MCKSLFLYLHTATFTRAANIYCETFPTLEDVALVYGVLVGDGIDSVFGDDENVEVFVTNRSCNDPGVRETAEVITLSRVTGTTTPTSPSPDPDPSTSPSLPRSINHTYQR